MKITSTILSLVLLSSAAFADSGPAAGNYDIDGMHSKVGFEIPHLVISTVEGHFNKYDGKIVVNDTFAKSKVDVNVDVASIDTGVTKRDDHLKSPDFFDAKKFPSITFKTTSIDGTPASFKILGNLTIHGVTRPVTLDAKYLGTVKDGYGQTKTAFEAKTKISRKDFGLTWNNVVEAGPVVGDEVTILLRLQAVKGK